MTSAPEFGRGTHVNAAMIPMEGGDHNRRGPGRTTGARLLIEAEVGEGGAGHVERSSTNRPGQAGLHQGLQRGRVRLPAARSPKRAEAWLPGLRDSGTVPGGERLHHGPRSCAAKS
jgi:hypothetical protein